MKELIRRGLEEYGLAGQVSPFAVQELDMYGQLLLKKNQVMNLTAITEPEQVARLHMLDCAALVRFFGLTDKRLLDVGTGAGFPGMVLKILVPSLDVTLLDSLGKRLDWLEEVCDILSLSGIRAVHARAEENGRDAAFREQFDFVTSRAVAEMRVLAELCLPYVKVGGRFLAMKSVDTGAETDAAAHAVLLLGGQLEPALDYTIPGTDVRHRLIPVLKLRPTPEKYPRPFAKIKKTPL